jgi:outer membrane protein OmpA-like peptidoglycan-associated protein
MLVRFLTVGVATLVVASPIIAQQRGTVEFGGFASFTKFDDAYGVNNGMGGGARVGAFLHPRVSLEFEAGAERAGRTSDDKDVNLGVLSARLTVVPIKLGVLSVLVGGGIEHSDNYFLESYGYQALVGVKLHMTPNVALRADAIQSWADNGGGVNKSLHLGMSLYRNPLSRTTTVVRTEMVPGPVVTRADSVSAAETNRLRMQEAELRRLRDSLARGTPAATPSSAAAAATMAQIIHFEHDKSDLSDTAKRILNEKVAVFRANPTMRIEIVGFTSMPGTADYNMALGWRRAEASKAYLVSQGVAADRVMINSRGQNELVIEGPGEYADAANRRGTFRLLIADQRLIPPGR